MNKVALIYANLIKKGYKNINSVPSCLVQQVSDLLYDQ